MVKGNDKLSDMCRVEIKICGIKLNKFTSEYNYPE